MIGRFICVYFVDMRICHYHSFSFDSARSSLADHQLQTQRGWHPDCSSVDLGRPSPHGMLPSAFSRMEF
jgi:hypothetical protein